MSIPDFQDFLFPLLQFCSDKQEHTFSEAKKYCYDTLHISKEDCLYQSSKGNFIADYRLRWAKTYLSQAKFLNSVKRGVFTITERGLKHLQKNPQSLRIVDLKQYDEFMSFISPKERTSSTEEDNLFITEKTPEERIEEAMMELEKVLATSLMEQIKKAGPEFFEKIVVRLISKMGYGEGQQTPYSHDGGIDGIINQDKLGLDAIYLQAKMWEANVGIPQLRNFVGALEENKASKGIFITSSDFVKEARQYIEKTTKRIILINGMDLVKLMIRYNVGVSAQEEKTYQIKSVDFDFFNPEE